MGRDSEGKSSRVFGNLISTVSSTFPLIPRNHILLTENAYHLPPTYAHIQSTTHDESARKVRRWIHAQKIVRHDSIEDDYRKSDIG